MFTQIQNLVMAQAKKLENKQLYHTDISEDLFEQYLSVLEDPDFKQEHNCNCCKQFLRQYGNIVGIDPDTYELITLWDFEIEGPYQHVPKVLNKIVREGKIKSFALFPQQTLGTPSSTVRVDNNEIIRWDHFYVKINKSNTHAKQDIATQIGKLNTNSSMLHRALTELTTDAFETVLELITDNQLYRGAEYQKSVSGFYRLAQKYHKLTEKQQSVFIWAHAAESCVRIRNTAIGTLLIDLSEGKDLTQALGSYDRVVAPSNYKRTSAIVTSAMVKKAQETVNTLGLDRSLMRRYANDADITINNVLFVNRDKKQQNLFAELEQDLPVDCSKLKPKISVNISKFLTDILPNASNVEILVENRLKPNFMSLIAPVDSESPLLFAWDNNFSWSYTSGLADSLKERVKNAGGKVSGLLRVSLDWFNYDDLDLHITEPPGNKIYYSSRRSNKTKGELDVDMNVSPTTREAVENIIYPYDATLIEGDYLVEVCNFTKRETENTGFNVEIEFDNEITTLSSDTSPTNSSYMQVATINYTKKTGFTIIPHISATSNTRSDTVYGVGTNKFQKVSKLMLSPNYWSSPGTGNKHFFFILEGAVSDFSPRGLYNEFLKPELYEHRRVFEVLGSKIKIEPTNDQLSGLGFSESMQNNCIVRVDNILINVTFGGI